MRFFGKAVFHLFMASLFFTGGREQIEQLIIGIVFACAAVVHVILSCVSNEGQEMRDAAKDKAKEMAKEMAKDAAKEAGKEVAKDLKNEYGKKESLL